MPTFTINNINFDIGDNPLFNCHETVYRFKNQLGFNTALPNRDIILNNLWPNGFIPANRINKIGEPNSPNDISIIQPGDIIGFWSNHAGNYECHHSMIAVNSTTWIGTNNIGVMGNNQFIFYNLDRFIFGGGMPDICGWFNHQGDLLWHHVCDNIPPDEPLYVTRG